jgi:hypothetical protein
MRSPASGARWSPTTASCWSAVDPGVRSRAAHPGSQAVSEKLGGEYVDLYDFADGRLEVRWKGQVLPYRIFDKDQRVSHTSIVENKRPGHALAISKAQQDLK